MQRFTRFSRAAFSQCERSHLSKRAFGTLRAPVRLSTTSRIVPQLRPVNRILFPQSVRHNTSLALPEGQEKDPNEKTPPPSYQLTFTCKPCGHRSAHMVSKQGYHHGTVIITCPGCKNRHVISDHLKIFMDEKSTLEDILKRSAEGGDLSKLVKKGKLGMRQGALVGNEGEEDIEFWEDGSESQHRYEEAKRTSQKPRG